MVRSGPRTWQAGDEGEDYITRMGDHRDASTDSLEHWRTSQNIQEATVPADSVVGRAFTVFWPVGRATWLTVPPTFDSVP